MNEPAAIEALEFARELVDLGVYIDWGVWGPWQNGQVAMNINIPSELYGTHENHFINQVNFEFGYVPLPKGPRAEDHVPVNRLTCFGVLPLTAKNAKGLIALYHDLFEFTKSPRAIRIWPGLQRTSNERQNSRQNRRPLLEPDDRRDAPENLETIETVRWMAERHCYGAV